ncbi:MAG: ADP-forming succinate--CoA ligase subunit beta [Acidobacteriota bacterium]|jgi:succinyl-CoA synthetase beta subunit|nr:ADP-forming succinate--CoA ligase subunit beta [Acidobacteriota bacterium]
MKVHEYQAKELFRKAGIPVPDGAMIDSLEQLQPVIDRTGFPCVVKAQVHAGGRGKGGGIRLAASAAEAETAVKEILGMQLVTPQTGPQGRLVRRVLIESAAALQRECYLALLVDRERGMPVFVACAQGGMEIEELARTHPEQILKVAVHPAVGLSAYHIRSLALHLRVGGTGGKDFARVVRGMYALMWRHDASLVEINPLVETANGGWLALDAKLNFDDNGMGRQAEIVALRDEDEEEPLEVRASRFDLNYIRLDGSIGCMVNGAGLAMATMDIIKLYGGEPANFLDVGGGTSEERVREAFHILLADDRVRAVLVNIFGGIVRTDRVARGIVAAVADVGLKVPVVVRLVGTNEEEGRKIIRESGLDVVAETDLDAAVRAAVALANGGKNVHSA